MDRNSAEVCWTDEQWSRVQKTVSEEAQKARVAASFLPLVGPMDSTTEGIPEFRLRRQLVPAGNPGAPVQRFRVSSDPTLMLTSLSTYVYLRGAEVADPELGAALGMFRRAANLLARVEDTLVFLGRPGPGATIPLPAVINQLVSVTGSGINDGLLPFGLPAGPIGGLLGGAAGFTGIPPRGEVLLPGGRGAATGAALVNGVVSAISMLETAGHCGPFACILGMNLFAAVTAPTGNLVMPRDRVLPFLDGQLHRSSAVPGDFGLVVATGGSPVELVVASDIGVRFLHINSEPRHVFRVSERVVLRARELDAVVVLHT